MTCFAANKQCMNEMRLQMPSNVKISERCRNMHFRKVNILHCKQMLICFGGQLTGFATTNSKAHVC